MEKRIPVVVIRDLSETDRIMSALRAYGIRTAEITFRTECAAAALRLAVKKYPDMLVGAGTVIKSEQCIAAVDEGASFIVSPGLSGDVARICLDRGVPYYPGCVTPTEIMSSLKLGFDVIKFFPADLYGGPAALKAFSSIFPQARFIPTGGVTLQNEEEYLALGNVAAVGGTYLVKEALKMFGHDA